MESERRKFGMALAFAVLITTLVFVSTGCASATTYTVCPSGCDYTGIQAAIDVASPGNTIIVESGTYYENVDVNKQLTLRGVDTGGGKPVVDAGGSGDVITLSADGITLEGFKATKSGSWPNVGIKVESNNNTITGNNASRNYYSIYLDDSSNNNIITGNIASYAWYGIYLDDSSNNNIITGNIASDNSLEGIILLHSSNNNITGNTASNNFNGIELDDSSNNRIIGNNASNNDREGIELVYSSNNRIIGNNASNNDWQGIGLRDSRNNTITDNNASNNDWQGIELWDSSNNNTITDNNASNNSMSGIELRDSSNNAIIGNDVSNNDEGIFLRDSCSSNNTITGNNASYNCFYGIWISKSSNNTITGNNASYNGQKGIHLGNSNNNIIIGNIASYAWYGIYLGNSNNNTITGNTASSNDWYGIRLSSSSNNNTITHNNASYNKGDGINLDDSSDNKIYLNNFINNDPNVYSYSSTNIWNSTEPITYRYNGSTFTNYTGNYWSDYEGSDSNGDGIGDTPYSIDSDKDNYPLMEHFENYISASLKEKIEMEAHYILSCQHMNPQHPAHGAINNVYGAPTWVVPRENAMAILGLIVASEVLNNESYLEQAQLAANYLIRIQNSSDGAWYDQYSYTDIVNYNKSPTQTAEVMIAFYKLGYNSSRYNSMKNGAQYLMACQKVENKRGNDDGLLCGGKNASGQYHSWHWTHDNAYAYWALKAAEDWATIEDDISFASECANSSQRILDGINTYLYDPATGVWHIAIDENGNPLKNPHLPCLYDDTDAYPSWIQYAPQMLDLPVEGVNSSKVGEWIHNTFQQDDGSCIGYWCEPGEFKVRVYPKVRKYPGLSFQASLCWFDTGHASHADAAVQWVENSGLWNTTHGGWVDWNESESGNKADDWLRFIDTSFYAIASWNGGYDFTCDRGEVSVGVDSDGDGWSDV